MDVYIDVLFLVNFISDFSILLLCDMNFSKRIAKKIISSLIGSLYACLFVFNLPQIIYSLPAKIVVLLLMCFVAFYPCKLQLYLEKCASFLLVSVLFSGVFYAGSIIFNNPYFLFGLSDIFWLLSLISASFICRYSYIKIKNKLYFNNRRMMIQYNNKRVFLNGIVDTGNVLKDPVSSMPVLMIDKQVLCKLFSPSTMPNNLCEFVNPEDFRVIPYKTISDQGIIYGFIPEKLFLEDKEIKDIIVAVAPSPISSDALINPQII